MDVHGSWARLSIRRKTLTWLAMLISVLLSMMGISAVIRSHATRSWLVFKIMTPSATPSRPH